VRDKYNAKKWMDESFLDDDMRRLMEDVDHELADLALAGAIASGGLGDAAHSTEDEYESDDDAAKSVGGHDYENADDVPELGNSNIAEH
jgi:NADPH-dependent curcumin reductase CurA